MHALPYLTASIVFGTDTGNTEFAARQIATGLCARGFEVECRNIVTTSLYRLAQRDLVVFGIPTWDLGEVQADFAEREADLRALPLAGRPVALFGLGDQLGYGDYFVDAMGWLGEVIAATGAHLIGRWPTAGYQYTSSRAAEPAGDFFCGLALDEDHQFELSDARINEWLDQLVLELATSEAKRGAAV